MQQAVLLHEDHAVLVGVALGARDQAPRGSERYGPPGRQHGATPTGPVDGATVPHRPLAKAESQLHREGSRATLTMGKLIINFRTNN